MRWCGTYCRTSPQVSGNLLAESCLRNEADIWMERSEVSYAVALVVIGGKCELRNCFVKGRRRISDVCFCSLFSYVQGFPSDGRALQKDSRNERFCRHKQAFPKRSTELFVGPGKDMEKRATNDLVTDVFDTQVDWGRHDRGLHTRPQRTSRGNRLHPIISSYRSQSWTMNTSI